MNTTGVIIEDMVEATSNQSIQGIIPACKSVVRLTYMRLLDCQSRCLLDALVKCSLLRLNSSLDIWARLGAQRASICESLPRKPPMCRVIQMRPTQMCLAGYEDPKQEKDLRECQ